MVERYQILYEQKHDKIVKEIEKKFPYLMAEFSMYGGKDSIVVQSKKKLSEDEGDVLKEDISNVLVKNRIKVKSIIDQSISSMDMWDGVKHNVEFIFLIQ